MSDIAFSSATELLRQLGAGELGVLELCDLYIARIEKFDAEINAVVVRDFDRARDRARQLDQLKPEQRGRLCGLPMTIKESYDIEGLPTTWGLPAFKDTVASSDSEVVRRYKEAGGLFLGKTNVPANLADFQSYNEVYGTTNNPWDKGRTPGGSSGGSAAAMAAGFSALESGSDIGGSIRNPAHFCGVYGHKPTWCIVPPQGHALPGAAAGPDIAVCGPLARSAEDLALALDVIAAAQPLDSVGWSLHLPKPDKQSLAEYRVAVWPDDERAPVDQETRDKMAHLQEVLQSCGATVSTEARPQFDLDRSHQTYLTLMHSIMGAAAEDEVFQRSKALAAELDPADRSNAAMMARGMCVEHRDWLRANNAREKLRYAWREFFQDWDILLCPQMATAAFAHDQSASMSRRTIAVDGEPQDYFQQVFWSGLITAAYLPSTVFPAGLSNSSPVPGLPIGIQAVSAEYNDYITIDFCRLLAREIGGMITPPGLN